MYLYEIHSLYSFQVPVYCTEKRYEFDTPYLQLAETLVKLGSKTSGTAGS